MNSAEITESPTDRLTRELQRISEWHTALATELEADLEGLAALGKFDQEYVVAYWNIVCRRVAAVKRPLRIPLPSSSSTDCDAIWQLMHRAYGWDDSPVLLPDDVDRRLTWFKQKLSHEFEKEIREMISVHQIESPIEQIFLIHWKYERIGDRIGLHLGAQEEITTDAGIFRVDFSIRDVSTAATPLAVVELDGHEFHERTRTQAERDRKRDRAVLGLGIPTVRFTGAEIVRDPRRCVYEGARLAITQANGKNL